MIIRRYIAFRLLLLYVLVGVASGGGWAHHRPKSRPTKPPVIAYKPPSNKCHLPASRPSLPDGRNLNVDYIASTEAMSVEDRLLLSPVVFEGAMVSRTNTYNSLYFVSFKVFRVLKGRIPRRLHGQIRLLYQTQSSTNSSRNQIKTGSRRDTCPPVPFNVRSGKKYILFVKKMSPGRYVSVFQPETLKKKVRKAIKKTFCSNCVTAPIVQTLKSKMVREGRGLKMNCKVTNKPHPPATITWYKDGAKLESSPKTKIETRRKRSKLVVEGTSPSDAGMYSCKAENILALSESSALVTIRHAAPYPSASECPIESFCLNGGTCQYYQMIGELVCRCTEGFDGQRCQFKKARVHLPVGHSNGCDPYGHDIHLAEICAAWNSPPVQEMTREEYQAWIEVEKQLKNIKSKKFRRKKKSTDSSNEDVSDLATV